LDRIDPGKPYQNGAHEKMRLDMMKEREHKIDGDLKMHQTIFKVWRKEYNEERPHEALNMKKPAKVNDRGFTIYQGRKILISNGFNVGLDIKQKDRVKVWFAHAPSWPRNIMKSI